jgi:hypothetical protein
MAAIDIIRDPSQLRKLFGSTPILIGEIRVDVLLEESPDLAWEIPEHRIDAGTTVADSRYQRPIGVTLDCIFLDPEISVSKALGAAAGFGWDSVPWREKRDALYDLMRKNQVVTIITPSELDYSDMMITAINPTITNRTSSGFWFRLSARRVEIVTSAIEGIDASLVPDSLKPKKNDQSKKKTAKKKTEGKKTPEPAKERRASILKRITEKGSKALEGLL